MCNLNQKQTTVIKFCTGSGCFGRVHCHRSHPGRILAAAQLFASFLKTLLAPIYNLLHCRNTTIITILTSTQHIHFPQKWQNAMRLSRPRNCQHGIQAPNNGSTASILPPPPLVGQELFQRDLIASIMGCELVVHNVSSTEMQPTTTDVVDYIYTLRVIRVHGVSPELTLAPVQAHSKAAQFKFREMPSFCTIKLRSDVTSMDTRSPRAVDKASPQTQSGMGRQLGFCMHHDCKCLL